MMSKKENIPPKNEQAPKFVIDSTMQKGCIPNESLEAFPQNYDFIPLIQKLKEIMGKASKKKKSSTNKNNIQNKPEPQIQNISTDWTMQLAVINYMRRLFKFEKPIFNQIFYGLKLYENILDCLNSIRSLLAQNAIILFNEVFSIYVPEHDEKNQKSPIINLIKMAIPSLILKANTSQSFIKNEAKTCLETIVNNMKYNDTLITLLQSMNTKKIADFELAYTLCNKLVKNLGKEFFVNNKHFSSIILTFGNVYQDNKNDLYKRRCKSLLGLFEEVMSKDEFNKKLEQCGKKEKELIDDINYVKVKVQNNTKKEIHHYTLKSKDKDKDKNKSLEKPKAVCKTKPILKKNLNIKLVKEKIEQKENCANNSSVNQEAQKA